MCVCVWFHIIKVFVDKRILRVINTRMSLVQTLFERRSKSIAPPGLCSKVNRDEPNVLVVTRYLLNFLIDT